MSLATEWNWVGANIEYVSVLLFIFTSISGRVCCVYYFCCRRRSRIRFCHFNSFLCIPLWPELDRLAHAHRPQPKHATRTRTFHVNVRAFLHKLRTDTYTQPTSINLLGFFPSARNRMYFHFFSFFVRSACLLRSSDVCIYWVSPRVREKC